MLNRHSVNAKEALILLVEDDPGDQELTMRALDQDGVRTDLRIVNDGEEALDYLFRRGEYEDPLSSPRPGLVLLDLNMPKVDGRDVLEQLRQSEEMRTIPVVVFSTSSDQVDVVRSYNLGCNSFIQKPVEPDRFFDAVRSLRGYWFDLVTLPAMRTVVR